MARKRGSENRSLIWEQDDLDGLKSIVDMRMKYYNTRRRHSSLGNKAPAVFLKEHGFQSRRSASQI